MSGEFFADSGDQHGGGLAFAGHTVGLCGGGLEVRAMVDDEVYALLVCVIVV